MAAQRSQRLAILSAAAHGRRDAEAIDAGALRLACRALARHRALQGDSDNKTPASGAATHSLHLGPLPQPVKPVPSLPSGLTQMQEVLQLDQPNLQTARNQCVPMAVANVVGCLRPRHDKVPLSWPLPHRSHPGIGRLAVGDAIAWQPVPVSSPVAQIDTGTRRNGVLDFETGIGTDSCPMIDGMLSYFASQGAPGRVVFRHQGSVKTNGAGGDACGDDILDPPLAGLRSSSAGPKVTWEWIFSELQ